MNLNKRRIGAYLKATGKQDEAEAEIDNQIPAPKNSVPLVRTTLPQVKEAPDRDPGTAPSSRKRDIAIYLMLIGKDEASQILSHLSGEEVEAIVKEIASIPHVNSEEADRVLKLFKSVKKTILPETGGTATARRILVDAFGEQRGNQLYRQAVPEKREVLFEFLAELSPDQVMILLAEESTAVKSIVLAQMPGPAAAKVLQLIPRNEQTQIALRLAKMGEVEREVLERIHRALKERQKHLTEHPNEDVQGSKKLAEIMRHLDPDLESRILGHLEAEAPEVVNDIRDGLFTIDTLVLIEDRGLQKFLATLPDRQIALMLKGKSDVIRKKILGNMSQNRAQLVAEEYTLLGAQPKKEVDEATREFLSYLRKLEQRGEILVRRDDDTWVT